MEWRGVGVEQSAFSAHACDSTICSDCWAEGHMWLHVHV